MGGMKSEVVDYLRLPTLDTFINMTYLGVGVVEELLGNDLYVPIHSDQAAIKFYTECLEEDLAWFTLLSMDSLMGYLRYIPVLTPEEDEYLYQERLTYPNTAETRRIRDRFIKISNLPKDVGLGIHPSRVAYGSLEFVMTLLLLDGTDNYDFWTFKGNNGLINCINEWDSKDLVDNHIIETFTRYVKIHYKDMYGKGVYKLPIYVALSSQLTKAEQYLGGRERVSDTLPEDLKTHKQSTPSGIFNKIKELYRRLTKTVTDEEI